MFLNNVKKRKLYMELSTNVQKKQYKKLVLVEKSDIS